MYRILLAATRICLFAFLVGGFVVVAGQTLGIVVGFGPIVTTFGTDVADSVCVIAGIAGILAFLTCYAGAGGGEVAAVAADLAATQSQPVGRWTLAAARGKETAGDNAFVDALEHALGSLGRSPGVEEIVQEINVYFTQHGRRQCATYSTVDNPGTGPFFHVPRGSGAVDHARIAELHRLDNARFGISGRGVRNVSDPGDYFAARTTALAELLSWLGSGTHDRRARVVVGDPGSGKTALLGRLLMLTDRRHPARRHLRPEPEPGPEMDVLALHARGDDVFAELATVLGNPRASHDELQLMLSVRDTPLLVIVDGLDEAPDSGHFARMLRPFTTLPEVRLVIGSRRPLLPELGTGVAVIDLDAAGHLTSKDLASYARDVLLDAQDPDSLSPYRGRFEDATEVGEVIAASAGHMFLYAQVTASAVVKGQITVDTTEPGWKNRLPNDINQAYSTYLARFGDQRRKVERLLRPLAYAQGAGLPRSAVWSAMATALSGERCTAEDVHWLLETAGEYIAERPSADGPVHRLFHETMAGYLRRSFQDADSHRAITFALLDLVPADPSGRREWTVAHPYLRRHLATHAAAAGLLDRMLADTDFLVHASPDDLLRALHGAPVQTGGAIYRASASVHRHLDHRRRQQLLAMDAARFNAGDLHRDLSRNLVWATRWATGQQISPALRTTLPGGGSVTSVACTSVRGNAMAVTIGAGRTVRTWELTTGLPGATFELPESDPVSCATAPDRPLVIIGDDEGTVWTWDLITGARTGYPSEQDCIHAVAYGTLDGVPIAVTGGEDGSLHVVDLVTHDRTVLNGRRGWVKAVAYGLVAGRPTAATLGSDGVIRLWDLAEGTLSRLVGPHEQAMDLALAELDGEPVVVTASDSTKVWDVRTGAARAEMGRGDGWANAVTCTILDGRPVAVIASDQGTVRVRDLATGESRATLTGHRSWVNAVTCVEVDGHPLAVTASDDGSVRGWDLTIAASGGLAAAGHTAEVTALDGAVTAGRTVVVSVSEDRTARVWDMLTGEIRCVLTGHGAPVYDVACTVVDDRPVAVTGVGDGTVGVWDLDTGQPAYTLQGHSGLVYLVSCTEVGGRRTALSASSDGTVRVWDLAAGDLTWVLDEHEGPVRTIAVTSVGGDPVLLTGGHVGPVRMWNLATGEMLATLPDSAGGGVIATTTIGGRPVAVVNSLRDNSTGVWDLAALTRTPLAAPPAHALTVQESVRGNGPVAVLACLDRTVQIWDLVHDERLSTLHGLAEPVRRVGCLTIDGRPAVVTIGNDDTVRLWDLGTAREMATFDFAGPVGSVRYFAQEARLVVATGWDLAVLEKAGHG
ncbi:NACHT domain-containing protein [Amycolatopsis umgeniensis]|uniref:WD40 repeat protein n=1 Tax=Amycolatopsis umgeniensis TaxID=336628 RepID=A0A841BDT7_9PSEU|nr:WD40 repeat protein [Amycolatopsis umgeniensis]